MIETRPVRDGRVVGGAGYRLDRPEELEPGVWTFEIWYRDMKLVSQSFDVYDEAAQAAADSGEAPSEFVTQVLEPTGGKIPRPKGWFYAERHHGPVYDWMISREDTHDGTGFYTTGVRIQMFCGVRDGTGKSAKQFIHDFIAAKKKEATKVIKTCEPKKQDLFTRVCLETEEEPHHILYSLFWGSNDFDYAVVVIAGTTKALWDTYAPVFDQMSFELIDLKRFEK